MPLVFAHSESFGNGIFAGCVGTGRANLSQIANMTDGWYLKEWRKKRGKTLEGLAEDADTSAGYVSDLEKGKRRHNADWLARFAKALEIEPRDLFRHPDAEVIAETALGYPLVGKVGAGGLGLYEDDYEMGAALDYIEPLPGMPIEADIIALETDGDSMAPLVFDGDLAFFGPVRQDVEALLNQRVMARLADGRKFFKILKKGSTDGRFTLRSLNPATPDIEDVVISWVLPYRGSRPRRGG